jgi:polygalacturonase
MHRLIIITLGALALKISAATLNVASQGADPTGARLCTEIIQSAIDETAAAGGGEVILPEGIYKVTALTLKSQVTLRLNKGAILRPSPDSDDYGKSRLPTVGADQAEDIQITGEGVIEGGGDHFYDDKGVALSLRRPHYIIHFKRCKGIRIEGVTLRDSMHWTCRLQECENIHISQVTIRNKAFSKQRCTDGIDLVCCRHALIENCDIESGDDGIVFKSELDKSVPTKNHPAMSDIRVRDCIIATTCNAVKIGTETVGDIHDILVERITVRKHREATGKNPIPSGVCIAAIALQSNDGAKVHHITCRDFMIEDCHTPLFIQLQDRDSHRESELGSLGDLVIENIVCKRSIAASQINASQGARLGKITLKNFDIATQEVISETPASPKRPRGGYPEAKSNGLMPAYGLFARDVDGLTLQGEMVFHDNSQSGRKAVVLEGIHNLDLSGLTGSKPDGL